MQRLEDLINSSKKNLNHFYKKFKYITSCSLIPLSVFFFNGCNEKSTTETQSQQNTKPYAPSRPEGRQNARLYDQLTYTVDSQDPDGDRISFRLDLGDNNITSWSSYMGSGSSYSYEHKWNRQGSFLVKAQCKDEKGLFSDWSQSLMVKVEGYGVQELQLRPTKDTYVDQDQPSKVFGSDAKLWVSTYDASRGASAGEKISYLYFDYSRIPSNAVIDSARLGLLKQKNPYPSGYNYTYISVCPLAQGFSESTTNWNNSPILRGICYSLTAVSDHTTSADFASWDITEIISDIQAKTYSNNGLALWAFSGKDPKLFFSKEGGVGAILDIYYHIP